MKKKVMILCTGLFLIFGSCVIIRISGRNNSETVHKDGENKNPLQEGESREPEIVFEDYSRKIMEEGRLLLEVKELCPVIRLPGREEIAERMNRVFEQQHTANASVIQETQKAARSVYQSLPEGERSSWTGYRVGYTYETVYLSPELLSIREECSRNTTGTAEVDALAYTFAVPEGKLLALSDVFADGKAAREAIQQKIKDALTAEPYRGRLLEDYESYLSDILKQDNFYLNEKGMVVICNPGIVTDEDCGYIEVTIPYGELSGLLEETYLPDRQRGDGI